ncbi:MAG: hypothetical protein R3211_02795 [Balneolaceae bacterium]|nr:hypothetical protein [Balneolaceae bacterium]
MIPEIRDQYNRDFTREKYQRFLSDIEQEYDHRPAFRICETPVFIPNLLKKKLVSACRHIYEVVCQPDFKQITQGAINHPSLQVPAEDYHTRFLQMDFGVCENEKAEPEPQLIELQGFPSLYFFQDQLAKAYRRNFDIPTHMSVHPEGHDSEDYLDLLREVIVGDHDPNNVVLLDVEPEKQHTYIDFLGAAKHLGVKVLCITDLKKSGRKLYYIDEEGNKIRVERIYNRVIFDELNQRNDLQREFYFRDDVEVEWVGHPSWFFRISKYTLPLLENPYIPESHFLNKLEHYPEDLSQYVLKPLYSFAGSGVRLEITREELEEIEDKENYILQKRVQYSPVIQTPTEPAKCEIRMMMIWEKGHDTGRLVNNLVRLSKGKMSGVKYNKDKEWVGASIGFFE